MKDSTLPALLAILFVAACGQSDGNSHADSTGPASTIPSAANRAEAVTCQANPKYTALDTAVRFNDDTGVVKSTGPIVVAAFPITQAQVDSDPDIETALNDFQNYLGEIAAGLRPLGVPLAVRYASPVRLQLGARMISWPVTAHSGGVAYLLIAPGCESVTLWGVHTGTDLLDTAKPYFANPAAAPGRTRRQR